MTDETPLLNPAGRLHAILTRYNAVAKGQLSHHEVWAAVWGINRGSSRQTLTMTAGAASLLHQTYVEVRALGRKSTKEMFDQNVGEWRSPFFPDSGWNMRAGPVSAPAMSSLAAISDLIAALQPERRVPTEDERNDLTAQVDQLLADLDDDAAVPESVRRLIRLRLGDIKEALDHVEPFGPDGIESACARLMVSLVHADLAQREGFGKNAAAFCGRAFKMFAFVDTVSGGGQAIAAAAETVIKAISQ